MCESCDGSGYTDARRWLLAIARLLLRAGQQAVFPNEQPYPSPEEMQNLTDPPPAELEILTTALAGRKPFKHAGYDAKGDYQASIKIIRAAGLDPDRRGVCPECQGEGHLKSKG